MKDNVALEKKKSLNICKQAYGNVLDSRVFLTVQLVEITETGEKDPFLS